LKEEVKDGGECLEEELKVEEMSDHSVSVEVDVIDQAMKLIMDTNVGADSVEKDKMLKLVE